MLDTVARALPGPRYAHGEGIRWDAERKELLWVDIQEGRFLRATLDSIDTPGVVDVGCPVGAVTPRLGRGWILAAGRGLLALDESGTARVLADLEPEGNRMNDAACDPQGRLWARSMAYDQSAGAGRLYRLDLDGSVTTVLTGLTISNGIDWSPDGSTMYLNDSGPAVTWAFDVDQTAGAISRQRVFARHQHGTCDGLTVDDDGHLWIALWGGSAVERFDPAGRRVGRVTVAASQPSACCIAAGQLFVTTASAGLAEPANHDGSIFVADVDHSAPGVRAYRGSLPTAADAP